MNWVDTNNQMPEIGLNVNTNTIYGFSHGFYTSFLLILSRETTFQVYGNKKNLGYLEPRFLILKVSTRLQSDKEVLPIDENRYAIIRK